MPRPPKYATAREAAENNLYSRQGGLFKLGLTLPKFIELSTSRCTVCGAHPEEAMSVRRKDGAHVLKWNYVLRKDSVYRTVCGTCKKLVMHFDVDKIVKHCARIMAKRMHDKRRG